MDPTYSLRTSYPQLCHLAMSKWPHYLVVHLVGGTICSVFGERAEDSVKTAGMRAKFGRRAHIPAYP
ncbi:hypothetical protein D3C81_2295340 [compost metagenome]